MANVIRQDVVRVDFETSDALQELEKLRKEFDAFKKKITGGLGDEEFDELGDKAEKAGKKIDDANKSAGKLKSTLVGIGKVSLKATIAGVTAAAGAVGGLVYKSVSAFSEFEQLKGGVETLFGTNGAKSVEEYAQLVGKSTEQVKDKFESLQKAQTTVLANAQEAYKTSGLSANDYMTTVTSFSASLISSVKGDTEKAATMADSAIVDMADNANKMGTDMGMIQNAYQGFAKQNYQMLDNLKLGFGGTKTEMERLVKEAAVLDKSVKANDLSFGNITKAIHAHQVKMGMSGITYKEYTELVESGKKTHEEAFKLLGTTAKEANFTVQGSFKQMQGAWGNILTAVGSGEGLDTAFDNLIESVEIWSNNVLPVAERSLLGLGKVFEKLAPKIGEKLPQLIEKFLPSLLSAATSLLSGLVQSLPSIVGTVARQIPSIVAQLGQAIIEGITGKKVSSDAMAGIAKMVGGIAVGLLALIPAMKGFKALKSLKGLFGKGEGGEGGGDEKSGGLLSSITNTFKSLAKTKPTVILKGMANMAIILGGFAIMGAALMAVAPYMAKLSDGKSLIEVIGVIAALGLVGAPLTKFAASVGNVPIMTVLKGLANIGIVIAGMSALFLLIGAVSLLNFDYMKMLKIVAIIGVLGTVGAALSVFAGIVGLIPIPVVLAGLANMALVLGGITAIIAAFGALSKIEGFTEFLNGAGEVLVKICNIIGEMAGSLIGGLAEGISNALPAIGENLGKFGENIKPLFENMKGVDMGGVGKFFTALVGLLGMATGNEIIEGIKSFFGGDDESAIAKFGTELSNFAKNSKGFFDTVATLDEGSFAKGGQLFDCLAKIKDLPATEKGGATKLSAIATDLGSFSSKAGGFFTSIKDYDLEKVNQLWSSLGGADSLTSETIKSVNDGLDGIIKKVSDLPNKMAEGIKASGNSLATAFVEIWTNAVKQTAKPVNKLISGANWILKEFGAEKTVAAWTPYARGTGGHKGGNALVNDGRGAEIVQMPNGRTFIPRGRNVFLPNAPKGMKVLSAENTAKVMGKKSPTFRYASGNIDIWDFMDNSAGLIDAVKNKFVNYNGVTGLATSIGKGMVNTISGQMTAWAKKLYDEFGALSLEAYNPSKGVEQWRTTVIRALKMEGLYSEANVARTLMQMRTESGGNPRAINLWDSNAKKGIPSKGLMQVIDPTFAAYAHPKFNKNIYDPLSNILASIRYATSRYGSLEKAFRGVGYSNGVGTVSLPTQPSSVQMRYTPENSYNGGSAEVEYNTYAPVFNLTISGTSDDRTTARKVKRWVKEAMEETFESMSRRSPSLQAY